MGSKPKHVRRRVRDTRSWRAVVKMASVTSAALLIAAGFTATAASASGGSDDPTPYTVSNSGITLPSGDVFPDGGHVNIKYTKNGGAEQGASIHFESLNWPDDNPKKYYIGKSSIPWSAFGLSGDFCVTWVQISMYNQHFGEGGQTPICSGTIPPVDQCVPEYEWVKKAKEFKYEHREKVMKEQARAKKQEQLRSRIPAVEGVKEAEYNRIGYGYTRWLVQKQTYKGELVNNGTGVGAAYYVTPDMLVNGVDLSDGFRPLGNHDQPRKIGDRFNLDRNNQYVAHRAGQYMYALLKTETSEGTSPTKSGWSTTSGPTVIDTKWFVGGAPDSSWTATGNERWKDGVEPKPASWGPWGEARWYTPHQITGWLDQPVTEVDMPGGPWVLGEWKFLNGDESKRYRYVQYDTRQVLDREIVSGPEWHKKGEQPAGWTLVEPTEYRWVIVKGPIWSSEKPGDGWEKTGKERKVNCLVTPPNFSPGTCQAPGSVNAPETDTYSWVVTGPANARVYTAVPKGDNVLTGQTVFGPYDTTQTDWKSEDCQPFFEVEQRCGYVKITYHNESPLPRWPDYGFTGDTKEPTDYGSGPTWNTVKVEAGESKVIFERQFDEDYYDRGPIEVWYQDILGAERDIDTPMVTLTIETDCDPNEVFPVLPETSPQVCTPPNGDLTGGSITLPDGPEGLEYAVFKDGVEVEDLTNLEPGDYQVVATVVKEHTYIADGDVWDASDDGQSATTTVTIDAAEDCTVVKPPTPPTNYGEWEDDRQPVCGDTQVSQTRWVREYDEPVWDEVNQVWIEDKVGTVTEETRMRDLTAEELDALEEECTELPPPPEEPEEPKDKVKATDVKFVEPTLVCEDGDWVPDSPGKVIIPKSDGVVYLIKNKAGKYVEIDPGTVGVTFEKVSVIAKAVDEDAVLKGKSEWSHTFKPVKKGGGDCELATTGTDMMTAIGLSGAGIILGALLLLAVSRLRKRENEVEPYVG